MHIDSRLYNSQQICSIHVEEKEARRRELSWRREERLGRALAPRGK